MERSTENSVGQLYDLAHKSPMRKMTLCSQRHRKPFVQKGKGCDWRFGDKLPLHRSRCRPRSWAVIGNLPGPCFPTAANLSTTPRAAPARPYMPMTTFNIGVFGWQKRYL